MRTTGVWIWHWPKKFALERLGDGLPHPIRPRTTEMRAVLYTWELDIRIEL